MPRYRTSRSHRHGHEGSQAGDDEYEEVYSQTDTESNFSQAETVRGDGPPGSGGDRRSRPMLGFYSPTPMGDVINLVNAFTSNRSVSNDICRMATDAAERISAAARTVRALETQGASQDEMRSAQTSLFNTYEAELRALSQNIEMTSPTAGEGRQPTSALLTVLTMRLPPRTSEEIATAISGLLTRNSRFLDELNQREGGSSSSGRSFRDSGGRESHRSHRAFRQPSDPFEFTSWGSMFDDMFEDSMFDDPMPGGRMPGGRMPGVGMPGGGMPGGGMPGGGMPGGGMPGGGMPRGPMFGGAMFDESMFDDGMPGGSMPHMGGGGYGNPPYGSSSGGYGGMPPGFHPRGFP